MSSTKMAGFRIWRELWLWFIDLITGKAAADREAWRRHYRKKREAADFKSLCDHEPSPRPGQKPTGTGQAGGRH